MRASFVFAALLAGSPAAQLATSANARLDGLEFDSGGGGACSISAAGWFGMPWVAGAASGPNANAAVGFLNGFDPEPTNAPVLFGVAPWFGTKDGGTALSLSGLNFQKLGAAATLHVDIGPSAASNVQVLSDTQVTLVTPPGTMGPAVVRVSSVHGVDALSDGYVYTPAVLAAPTAALGTNLSVRDLGPSGAAFELWSSPSATSIPLPPYGVLLIGPSPLFRLVQAAYPPSGIHEAAFPVPNDPQLAGVLFHFQSVALLSIAPLVIVLTNRSTTTFQ